MKMINRLLIIISCSLVIASLHRVEVDVQEGDTLNKILRTHKISTHNINQINLLQLREFNTIAPHNTISMVINSESGTLLTCKIEQGYRTLVLNKLINGYQLNKVNRQTESAAHHIHTNTSYPLDSAYTVYKRLAKSIDYSFKGHIDVLVKDSQVIALKTYHPEHVTLAFIYVDSDQPYYTTTENHEPRILFSRAPTDYKRISSHFDPQRLHPISNKVKPHLGVDLAGAINTPIWAAADGKVIHKSTDTGYGNLLIIAHPSNISTHYAHMNKFHQNIQVGDTVKAFETIGYIGSTGHSTGPHLHYELRINDKPHDPLQVKLTNTLQKQHTDNNFF